MPDQPMPEIIPPMLAKAGKMPADPAQWGFEIKWDGLRAIVYLDKGEIRVLSRNHKDITAQYPELAALASSLPRSRLILDGEIVAFGADGRPSFSRLQHRMGLTSPQTIAKLSREIPATYIIFDVLYQDGRLLVDLPYSERRHILEELSPSGRAWQTPAHKVGEGPELLAASREVGLEGILAKRLDSKYETGKRSGAWLKIKNQRRQELVIAGWVPGRGKRQGTIGALLVGYWDRPPSKTRTSSSPRLVYAGKVGTGFSSRTLADLAAKLTPLRRDNSPFAARPPVAGAVFVDPLLVGEFEFTEWTPHNTLRHPSFKGLRTDKDASAVVKEPSP
ncbi:non-homologous end-joining DNA ligase [Anaeroselena agilis]|uniref:DNA ligase (ATP) n=1 Tax=Anaeroselena agilis TaxID=3063788 RepID=A0ABU3NUH2_9FIRM|nr:non-homologous end-joining DNA ligase [Selenomonadales bacterium 4137-cl]